MAQEKAKPKAGRPSQCRDPHTTAIIAAVRAGNPQKAAAACGKVSEGTVCAWLRRGREDTEAGNHDTAFAKFLKDYREAEGQCMAELLAGIKAHGKTSFAALAWIMERRWPELWGVNRHEIKQLRGDVDRLMKLLEQTVSQAPPQPPPADK